MTRPFLSLGVSATLMAWLAAACAPQQVAQAPGGQVWIDAPLHGDHLPLAPYDVVSHANLSGGVASFELSANGQVVRTDIVDDDQVGQTLAYITQRWEPAAPGIYVLQVRAADGSGTFGPMAEIQVSVGDPTATPTPEALPPTSTPMALLSAPQYSTTAFSYRRAGRAGGACGEDQVTIQTMAMDARIVSVVLFFRLAEIEGPGRTEWTAEAMNPLGGGAYSLTLRSQEIPGVAEFVTSYLQVQLVATGTDGGEVARTLVFSDVMLTPCS